MRCEFINCPNPPCRGSWLDPNDPTKPILVLCEPHGREKETEGYRRVSWR